uniref:FLYWCH-type domain-containing protein n=1 Tax=Homalodisca liturata TaxID=320908 RepID=A0A1B6IQ39_9HEMI
MACCNCDSYLNHGKSNRFELFQAMNVDDDPDFEPSPKKSDECTKLYHDGNGYYYTLVKDENGRKLHCKTRCGVTVALGPREKPLTRLRNSSISHTHPPGQLTPRSNVRSVTDTIGLKN